MGNAHKSSRERPHERHPAANILRYLALNGQTRQVDLIEKDTELILDGHKINIKLGVSQRTLLYTLPKLKEANLIELTGRKPGNKLRGAHTNVWGLTFTGILTVLKWHISEDEVDQLVASYPDSNLIFKKWGYIKKNIEVKKWVIIQMALTEMPHLKEKEFDKKFGKDDPRLQKSMEELNHRRFLYQVLNLEAILSGVLFEEYIHNESKNWGRPAVADYTEYLMEDPDLKRIINEFFREIELQYKFIKIIRKKYGFN